MPLRTIVTQNRGVSASEFRTGKNAQVTRYPFIVAADCSQLVISSQGFGISGSASEFNVGNDYAIAEQSLEANGVVVPVLYGGGRSKTVIDGAVDVQSDPILPSSFGLSKFSYNDQIWIKTKLTLSATGLRLPYTPTRSDAVAGGQCSWYDTAATTVSSTDVTGVYTILSGAAFDSRLNGYRPIILGRPLVDGRSFIAVGDSIAESFVDNGNPYPIHGLAFVQRSMRDSTGGDLLPCLNLARSASSSFAVSAGTKSKQLYKYARFGIDEYGTNNLTASTLQPSLQLIWSDMRAAGVEKIIRTKFLPRTNTTDNWATTANQTYTGAHGPGLDAEVMNNWFATELSAGRIDYLVGMDSISDLAFGGDRWKWRVNGTANYIASDTTHPTGQGHEFMAQELRPVLRSV